MNPLTDPGRLDPTTKKTLDDYGKHGLPPGDSTRAILAGDLFAAFGRADDMRTAMMPAIVWYIRNRLPAGCYGSYAAVELWIEERRAERRAREMEARP